MEVLLYVLTVLLVHGQQASGQGVSLELDGTAVLNFGLLGHSQIDTSDNLVVVGGNLVCRTDNTSCCRNVDNPAGTGGFGDWFYPGGDVVLFKSDGPLPSGQIYRLRRGPQVVRLRRDGTASTTSSNGIYRCEVADQNGVTQTRYVGLYTDGAGVVSISEDPQFSLISADPLEFTLTSTTTGGPPTTATWTLPNTVTTSDDTTLLNGSTATVRHTLTVTEKIPGEYMFSTTNARSGPPVSSSITVQDANPPTGLAAVQDSLTSILVSWTAPASGGASRTGYRISYQTGGGSEQSVDIGAGATSHTLTTGLQSGATYSISIVALSNELPSAVVGPEVVILKGVYLELDGTAVLNFDLLGHSDIDTSDDLEVVGGNLVCRTDLTACCRITEGTPQGQWYYPTGGNVIFIFEGALPSGQIYRFRRGPQLIRLRRELGSTTTANGIYRCEVADQNGVTQTRYVGLYTEGAGVVSISQAPQFSLISADPLEFTLTSTTTGGPPTTAFWTLPNTVTTSDDTTLLNGSTATVRHTLTVTEKMPGEYMFSTTNARSGPPVSSSITVQDANPPTGLAAVQDSPTSILVSWTAPASGGASRTGYRISYQTGGGSEQSVDIGPGATSHTLTGLQSGATYSISIVALSNKLPSAVVGPEVVILKDFEAPTVTAQVQSPTSIRVTFTQPSGSLAAESYDIQYTRVTGACQTLCGSVEDTGATTDVQSPFTITNLEEFSSYDITVTARAFNAMRTITEQAVTSPAVPSGPPQSVMTLSVTSSSITVQWGRVSCIDRNSEITGYTVRYGQTGSTATVMESVSGTSDRMFTASGLIPRTSYTFEVAAVSSEGTGPFSTGTTVETAAPDVPVPDPPVVTLGVVTATTVTLSWSPQPGVGQYEVCYVRAVGSQQHGACRDFIDTGSVTTTENSLTVAGLQEFSTYTVTVFAVNNAGRVPSEEMVITTPEAAPAPPRGVEVVNFTDTAITVHWEPLECIDINSQFEITGYTVRYGFASEPETLNELSSPLPVLTINILAPGVEYFFEVAAVNSNGETGEYSNRIIQTTSGGQSSCSAGGTETATVAAASVVVVLVVLILALSGVVIAVLVLKHKRGAPHLIQQLPMEAMVLTTFPESTWPNPAYQTMASGGRGQSQGNDGDHTYEYIVPPGLQSRDQPEPPHVYENT